MVYINGEDRSELGGKSLIEALESLGYNKNRVAVELNENIVPKSEYESTSLNDGDRVEIVGFVGGG